MRGDASAGPNPGGGFYGAPNNFDIGDQILRAAIREQVGSIVRRLHRGGAIENIGAGRASKWKLISVNQHRTRTPLAIGATTLIRAQ
jgi:hypothetical protein